MMYYEQYIVRKIQSFMGWIKYLISSLLAVYWCIEAISYFDKC